MHVDVRPEVFVGSESAGVCPMPDYPEQGMLIKLKKPSLFVRVKDVCFNLERGRVELYCDECDSPARKKPARPAEPPPTKTNRTRGEDT